MFLSNRGSFRPETSGAYTLRRRGRRRPKSGSAIGACAVARLAGSGGPIGDYYGSANTRGVVGRVALAGHRPRQPVALAYGLPPGPAVVAAAVGVRDGRLPLPERRARHLEGRLGEARVGAGADGPADGLAVEQVDDGRQVHLAAVVGQAELGHVADPRLVGAPGGEVVGAVRPQQQVGRGRVDLAGVGAVAPPARVAHAQPEPAHEPPHHLLRHRPAAPARHDLAHEPVAPRRVAVDAEGALDLGRRPVRRRVGRGQGVELVVVGGAGQTQGRAGGRGAEGALEPGGAAGRLSVGEGRRPCF